MVRKYGKNANKKSKAEQLFAELPKSPVKQPEAESELEQAAELKPDLATSPEEAMNYLAEKLQIVQLENGEATPEEISETPKESPSDQSAEPAAATPQQSSPDQAHDVAVNGDDTHEDGRQDPELRILTWDDVCPSGDRIEKIAEASYAEVYRVTNERGTSIIKVIRLESPIKPQTKAQEKSGLVDEEPHSEDDLVGELKISEWLADIPGFVVYKERYVLKGKAPKTLLETHQAFHKKMKRQDPDRLQFYPSPSRYLDETKFLVVELGDAGTALEDFQLATAAQLWDIFLHTAIALARAEDLAKFEHRDLHEGNLCIRQVGAARPKPADDTSACQFGYSGLEITILDYGLSRAEDPNPDEEAMAATPIPESRGRSRSRSSTLTITTRTRPVAYDLEKDLSIFTSTHAPQCKVYRQMRSFLLKGDRVHLDPEHHTKPYENVAATIDGPPQPISWDGHYPYTNILWLAYIYQYLINHFSKGGDKKELAQFKRATNELWAHLDPDAPSTVLSFPSAGDVVRYAAESGWITEEQLMDGMGGGERSRLFLDEGNTSVVAQQHNEAIAEEVITTEAKTPEAETTEVKTPEAKTPEAETTEAETTEANTTEEIPAETIAAEATATEPQTTEPQTTEPQTTEPQTTEPQTTEPQTTEPETVEPETTEPEATAPEATTPEATEAKPTEAKPVEVVVAPPVEEVKTVGTPTAAPAPKARAPKGLAPEAPAKVAKAPRTTRATKGAKSAKEAKVDDATYGVQHLRRSPRKRGATVTKAKSEV
ncbi:hypothetical protein QBC46DRAFT_351820 [Diplogelasinospora grovesii]|uniref:non-specific serine/threonine protein kinase n=1 Tax=Diplogelasinospora grovesii TaxID=303347 RepID=A0AAN6NBZ4_9PEZI|nr:hypothetical protein QBC46DRAFT_351820 [Diplogelasinospora grovesii]